MESQSQEPLSPRAHTRTSLVVENPLCNAGEVGLIPGQGAEIRHDTEQLIS